MIRYILLFILAILLLRFIGRIISGLGSYLNRSSRHFPQGKDRSRFSTMNRHRDIRDADYEDLSESENNQKND